MSQILWVDQSHGDVEAVFLERDSWEIKEMSKTCVPQKVKI